MPTSSPFSYFHGTESEQFSYYRIPRLLITGKQFRHLSTDAKLLYGLLLDRMGLSARNGWYDELDRNCLPSLMGAYSVGIRWRGLEQWRFQYLACSQKRPNVL